MNTKKYLPVPYTGSGSGKGGKKPTIEKDTLFSRDHLEAVLGFGEGVNYGLVNGLNSIKFNDELLSFNDKIDIKDIFLSWRMGYEDDAPIEYLLRGENTLISTQQKTLIAGYTETYLTPVQLRGQVRYIQLRLLVQALIRGDDKGNQRKNAVAFLIRYKPSQASSSEWRYVNRSTNSNTYRSLMVDSAKAYARDKGLTWELLSKEQQEEMISNAESVQDDAANVQIVTEVNYQDTSYRGFGFEGAIKSVYIKKVITQKQIVDSALTGTSYTRDNTYIITGKTASGYIHELTIPVPTIDNDDWVVEVMRVTPEYPQTEQYNRRTVGIQEVSAVLASYRKYPRTVLAHLVAPYSDQFTAVGDISAEMYGLLLDVPTNYNGFTHQFDTSQLWLGTYKKAWSNNNVWVLREAIMNPDWGKRRYEPNLMIDDASFYKWAQYCDIQLPSLANPAEFVYRHTFNDVITDVRDLDSFIKYVCSSFRGSLSERNGVYYLTVDTLEESKFFVTPEMISDIGYTYSKTELSTRWNQVKVSFQNEALDYADDFRILSDSASILKNGLITGTVQPVGCTDLSQAIRHAAYALLTNSRETTLVSFQVPRLGLFLNKFDSFLLFDPSTERGYSSRVERYDVIGDKNRLKVRYKVGFANGTPIKVVIHTVNGLRHYPAVVFNDYNIDINVNDYGVPTIIPDMPIGYYQVGDLERMPKEFKVLNITDDGTGDGLMYTVEASIQYPEKHAKVDYLTNSDPVIKFSNETFEVAFNRIEPPKNVRLRVMDFASKNGQPLYRLNFEEVPNAESYEATWYYSDEDGNRFSQVVYTSNSNLYPAMPANNIPITFELVAIASDGRRSRPVYLLRFIPKLMAAEDTNLASSVSSYGFYKEGGDWWFQAIWQPFSAVIQNKYSAVSMVFSSSYNPSIAYASATFTDLVYRNSVAKIGAIQNLIGSNSSPTQDYTFAVNAKFNLKAQNGVLDVLDNALSSVYGLTPTVIAAPTITSVQRIASEDPLKTGLKITVFMPDAHVNKMLNFTDLCLVFTGTTEEGVEKTIAATYGTQDSHVANDQSITIKFTLEEEVLLGKVIKVQHKSKPVHIIPFQSVMVQSSY